MQELTLTPPTSAFILLILFTLVLSVLVLRKAKNLLNFSGGYSSEYSPFIYPHLLTPFSKPRSKSRIVQQITHITSVIQVSESLAESATMALFSHHQHFSETVFVFVLSLVLQGVSGATFTFVNKCDYTVWPGVLGKSDLGITGFELSKGSSRSFQAPTGWSGRFWARTNCKFDDSGHGTCATGDCGSGGIDCNGAGASPPATLAEFTLGSAGSQDYYDVSLVDGYNLPMTVEANGGSGSCTTTGCVADLNRRCPSELKGDGGDTCRSACDAFGKPEYCCNGEYGSPSTCKPSTYSKIFKSACPKAYSYAYDDSTSTFTCAGADYTVTFCPSSPR